MRIFRLLLPLFLALFMAQPPAGPLQQEDVPEPLQPWVDWAVYGQEEELHCPRLFDSGKIRCAWPGRLELTLDDRGGQLHQRWELFQAGWIPLPGDARVWPLAVSLSGVPAVVVQHQGRPAVWAEAGDWLVEGRLEWTQLPESLGLPIESGLLRLEIGGEPVAIPSIEADGRLWLGRHNRRDAAGEADESLNLQVFRRVEDGHPLQVLTRLRLDVSGRQRELQLAGTLLEGLIPLRLESPLPARLEPDGRLRLQLRPGSWTIDVAARRHGVAEELRAPSPEAPWPEEEIWVFEAHNELRVVEIEGPPSVAPTQTNLPAEWRQFPAYRLGPGEALGVREIRRGDPQPEPDRLTLQRTLWLDFDGRGYHLQDRIGGTLFSSWRLETGPELALGRVVVDGEPQLITQMPDGSGSGVEVRRGRLQMVADARLDGEVSDLPAVGWDHDFQQVSANLLLPPGWRLFSANGSDNNPRSWLQRWTLLDLFLVLLAAIAAGRLWGWGWGAVVLVGLTLSWHAPGAPQYVWLSLLAAAALLRVLPPGRLRWLAQWYQRGTLLALVLIALPFIIDQIRIGIYPPLERPWQQVGTDTAGYGDREEAFAPAQFDGLGDDAMAVPAAPPPMASKAARSIKRKLQREASSLQQQSQVQRTHQYRRVDPKAVIQTGTGLPDWQWRSVQLRWNGPVTREQRVSLTLLSPTASLLMNLAQVLLVLLLAARMAGFELRLPRRSGTGAALLLAVVLLPLAPGPADAGLADPQFPGPQLLDTLRERLLAPPECLPHCVEIPLLRIQAAAEHLMLELEVHSAAQGGFPLPIDLRQWQPQQVQVDGEAVERVLALPERRLWLLLDEGIHRVMLAGPPPALERMELPLPLRPRRVEAEVEGWVLEGVAPNGVPEAQLQLRRLRAEDAPTNALEPAALPPFVEVERVLRLDLDWRVESRVRRRSPNEIPILLRIPLLEGESVVSESPRVVDGQALVQLPAGVREVSWVSTLEQRSELTLTAPDNHAWVERWRADISPIWHPQLDGIPVVHHQDRAGQRLPEWRPRPGEQVHIGISRPQAVPGPALTIERSLLNLQVGKRATDSSLELALRSSQGGRHTLTLPEGAALQSVAIDGRTQPIRQEGRQVTLPVTPGSQQIRLNWQQTQEVTTLLRTPVVDLGTPSVNGRLQLRLPDDRWSLLLGGPAIGPAVLFWGVLLAVLLFAPLLGRIPLTPLRTHHWLLLGIGLSQSPVWVAVLVVGWLFALGARGRLDPEVSKARFNWAQIGIALLTLLALPLLFNAVADGLLGAPQMQIAGNGSHAGQLNWYQDRLDGLLPQAWVISVPILAYRLLMLGWALWLAFALLRWLRWGWDCCSRDGLWRKIEFKRARWRKAGPPAAAAGPKP